MDSLTDVLDVEGDFTVNSSVVNTILSAGTIQTGGNFAQVGTDTDDFQASGTHTVVFDGTVDQTISFGAPGTTTNRFYNLTGDKSSGDLFYNSDIVIAGNSLGSNGTTKDGGVARTITVLGDVTILATAGFALDLSTVQVGGTLTVLVAGTLKRTEYIGNNQTVAALAYKNLTLAGTGTTTLGGNVSVDEDFILESSTLDMAGKTLSVGVIGGNYTQNGGTLVMDNALDVVDVEGNFIVNSGSSNTTSDLTNGTIRLTGDFAQTGSVTGDDSNFQATSNHTVELDGTGDQSISFALSGTGSNNHFGHLRVNKASGKVSVTSNMVVESNGLIFDTATTMEISADKAITVAGFETNAAGTITSTNPGVDRFDFTVSGAIDVDGLNFGSAKTNGLHVTDSGSFTKFDNVTFTNAQSGARHMRVEQQGPVNITFNNVSLDASFGSGKNITLEDTFPPFVPSVSDGGTDVKLHVASSLGAGAGRVFEEEINTAFINWGDEVDWIITSNGNWNTAANWSTGAVPVSTSEVFITLDGTYTVTLDVDATVAGLTLGGTTGTQTLSGSGKTLTLNGAGAVNSNGALNLTGGSTLAGSGTLTNQGTVTLDDSTVSGALDNQGMLVARGVSNLNGAVTTGAGTTLRVLGNNIGQNASLTAANGFTNNGTIELTSADSFRNATLVVTSGTLVNASGAAIQSLVGTDGGRTLTAELDNQGTVTINHPLTINKTSTNHQNSSNINLSGGSLTVNSFSSFSNTGSIDAPTDNLTLSTFTSFTNTGTVDMGAGQTLTITSGTFNQNAGTFDVSNGTLSLNSATLNFTGAFTTANTTVSLLGSTFAATGTLTHAASGTLTLNDSTVSGALDNQGTLLVRGLSSLKRSSDHGDGDDAAGAGG